MCGILGMYLSRMDKKINRTVFENALNLIQHRGPDNKAVFYNENIALGHVRLSILDNSPQANQPYFSKNKKHAIVFNGEIFNYLELKKKMQLEGIIFYTNSDTEVLLNLLITKGEKAIELLNGFFVFAWYDFAKERIVVGRDRYGEKPLFYSYDEAEKTLVFCSELKGVFHLINNRQIDYVALELLLQLNYIPAPLTIDKNIKKLEPGTLIILEENNFKIEKWFGLSSNIDFDINEKQAIERVREKVNTAVERRMLSDFPVGGFLSGGIDSSIVCALAKNINPNFETFSLGFKNGKFIDETNDAFIIAKKFNITHHPVYLSEEDVLQNAVHILNNSDEPFGDSSMIALFSLCKALNKKYKVMLSGDGADEVFGGYNKHKALLLAQKKSIQNRFIKAFGSAHVLLPKSRHGSIGRKARKIQKMYELLNRRDFEKYWYLATFNHDIKLNNLLKISESGSSDFKEELKQSSGKINFDAFFDYDVRLVLANDMLYKVDMASMYNGIEVRSPFLDHDLMQFTLSLPFDLKMKFKTQKYLLKKAFADVLPSQILNKPKHGFEVPLHNWLLTSLAKKRNELLNFDLLQQQNIFHSHTIDGVIKRLNSSNPGDTPMLVWTLMNFQSTWLNYYKN